METLQDLCILKKHTTSPHTNPRIKQSCEALITFQGHICESVGAVVIPPSACEAKEAGAEVAHPNFPLGTPSSPASGMESADIRAGRAHWENALHTSQPSAFVSNMELE